MDESRSMEQAWIVVKRIWDEQTADLSQREDLVHLDEPQLRSLFETFWDAQFEDDRRAVRDEVRELTRLITEAAGTNEA